MGLITLADRPELEVKIDEASGAVQWIRDRRLELTLVERPPLWELEINGRPVPFRMTFHEDRRGILQTIHRTTHYAGYSHGWGLQVARLMVPGDHSLHIQTRLKRVPMEHIYPEPGPNTHDVEMPLFVETVGLLGWRWALVRPDTTLRVMHLSGAGPFCHMSAEEGPVSDVNPKLWHFMRMTYPGMLSIPGVLYFRRDPDQWLFITMRRSALAYILRCTEHGPQFQVQYYAQMPPGAEFPVPEISIFWGRDLEEMNRRWDSQFEAYEEPPDWLYHTAWAVTGCAGPNARTFAEMGDIGEVCVREGGINGFWLYSHQINRSDTDTSPMSHGPNPPSGTWNEFRQYVRRMHDLGARVQVWLSACGMKPWGDMRPSWAIRGVDGKHWVAWGWDEHEFIVGCNPLDPGYRRYMLDWTRRYVEDFDIDGFFLDCGVFTFPPDFAPHHQFDGHFPTENGPAMRELFLEMWDIITRAKPNNFHMWYEGTSSELPGTGYGHATMLFPLRPPEAMTNQRMLYDIVRRNLQRGGKRLVWGSLHAYDLACGYAQWNPCFGGTGSIDEARRTSADPMNRFFTRFVRQRGTRDALGLADGVSWIDDLLFTVPELAGTLVIAEPRLQDVTGARHVITGEVIRAGRDAQGRPTLDLPGGAAFRLLTR